MSTIDEAAKAADWYQQMAMAMRQRDNCLAAIERWKGKLLQAEEHIADLANQVGMDLKAPGPDLQQIPAGAFVTGPGQGVDPSWSESAE